MSTRTPYYTTQARAVRYATELGFLVPMQHKNELRKRIIQSGEMFCFDYGGLRHVNAIKDDEPNEEPRAESSSTRETSSVANPTKLVWELADTLLKEYADKQLSVEHKVLKATVVRKAIADGVHESTAKTQVYRWAKARGY